MINLVYTVLLFNVLIIFFKLFEKYKINTLQALIVNYFTSAVFSLFYFKKNLDQYFFPLPYDLFHSIKGIMYSDWIHYSIIVGLLFMIAFYLYSYGVQKIGISISTISSKMSVIIPVTAALTLYPEDKITITKLIALTFAGIGIYLSSIKKEKTNFNQKFFWIIVLIFLSQGIVDSVFNDFVQKYPDKDNYAFFMILFLVASLTGGIILVIESLKNKHKIKIKNLLFGLIFGIVNFFSLFFFIQALEEMESSIVFPLASMGIIISSALIAVLIFKENMSRNNWIGIFSALIAIYLFL